MIGVWTIFIEGKGKKCLHGVHYCCAAVIYFSEEEGTLSV